MENLLKALNERPIAYYPVYRKITGSTTAGLLLSQLMYWFSKKSKIYKTDAEIKEETLLTKKEIETAKKAIKKLKFIKITREGIPAKTYYEIDWKMYEKELSKALKYEGETRFPKRGKLDDTNRGNCTPQKGETNTENTTETTTKTTLSPSLSNKTDLEDYEESVEYYEQQRAEAEALPLAGAEAHPYEHRPKADDAVHYPKADSARERDLEKSHKSEARDSLEKFEVTREMIRKYRAKVEKYCRNNNQHFIFRVTEPVKDSQGNYFAYQDKRISFQVNKETLMMQIRGNVYNGYKDINLSKEDSLILWKWLIKEQERVKRAETVRRSVENVSGKVRV